MSVNERKNGNKISGSNRIFAHIDEPTVSTSILYV